MRECRTLCAALDLMATKQQGAAADLLTQRLKAVEKAIVDRHWERAQWSELLPPEGATLMDREEDQMNAKEEELQWRLRGKGWKGWQGWPDQGKGKDKKEKGAKGKGKKGAA